MQYPIILNSYILDQVAEKTTKAIRDDCYHDTGRWGEKSRAEIGSGLTGETVAFRCNQEWVRHTNRRTQTY